MRSEAKRRLAEVPSDAAAAIRLADAALTDCTEEEALPLVARAATLARTDAAAWQWTGLLARAIDRHDVARAAYDRAAALAPGDRRIAHGRARVALEAGTPDARALFERALAFAPLDAELLRGHAAALAAEGRIPAATAMLDAVLARHPGWYDGQMLLGRLRWLSGDRDGFTGAIERALAGAPRDATLWRILVALREHVDGPAGTLASIVRARTATGDAALLALQEADQRSVAGEQDRAAAIFATLDPTRPEVAILLVRHLLRSGDADRAARLAADFATGADAARLRPYATVAARLLGREDPDARLVAIHDIGDRLPPLHRLATVLRGLHVARAQHLDQSVRGGTQTDGYLFARQESEIVALRAAVRDAVAAHVAALPPVERGHPTLDHPRDRAIRFAGAWSVRLAGAGHHAAHVHTEGWLSSALYVTLPPADGEAGWLTLGAPDAGLGLALPPHTRIEPRPGRLVLFPATMWHGTTPFASGERLTVAFDVAPPGRPGATGT